MVLNEALQVYYDSVEEAYIQDSQVYAKPCEGNINTPYNSLIFQYFTYVNKDYVSLVYNNVSYMGGAHPYSARDGITIDCTTGKIIPYSSFWMILMRKSVNSYNQCWEWILLPLTNGIIIFQKQA